MSAQIVYASIIVIAILLILVAYLIRRIRRLETSNREAEPRNGPTLESGKQEKTEDLPTRLPEVAPELATTEESLMAASTFNANKQYADWIDSSEVAREFAEAFVKACGYWDHPKAYSWVRAPRHAENLYISSFGWTLDFGANSFLVEIAIERSKGMLKRAMSGQLNQDELRRAVSRCVAGAVANNGSEYNGDYPIDKEGFMRFGVQGINVGEAVEYLIRIAELKLTD